MTKEELLDKDRWNKLLYRCIRALWKVEAVHPERTAGIKNRWVKWAGRVTGKICFFLRWD